MDGASELDLAVVLPVYNEQASIESVLLEWFPAVAAVTERFVFLIFDDGSSDRTPLLLEELRARLGARLEIFRHVNRGHGQTCLEGYREALRRGARWVLQIDSDGQCDPRFFAEMWRSRETFDVIYGVRTRRDDGFRRALVSRVLCLFVLVTCGTWLPDPNVPYRLMRGRVLEPQLGRVPDSFSLVNVAMALLLKRDPVCRHHYVPIRFRDRCGGEPTVRYGTFAHKAIELRGDIRRMLGS